MENKYNQLINKTEQGESEKNNKQITKALIN